MLHTEKTDQAYELFKSYARTPEHKEKVDQVYVDLLANEDNEDFVVIRILGLILDGVHYGNWLWNMPPSAPLAPTNKASRLGR